MVLYRGQIVGHRSRRHPPRRPRTDDGRRAAGGGGGVSAETRPEQQPTEPSPRDRPRRSTTAEPSQGAPPPAESPRRAVAPRHARDHHRQRAGRGPGAWCSRWSSVAADPRSTDEDVREAPATSSPGPATSSTRRRRDRGGLQRAVPGLRSTTPGRHDFADRIRPITETLKFAGAADRGRPRRRSRVPRRAVQHRRPRPDAARRRRGRLDRRRCSTCRAGPPARGDRSPASLAGAPLGRHRRPPEGPHRRPRGDRHDHAQLRRLLPGLLRC